FYFEGAMKTLHLYAKAIIIREAKRLGGESFVLGAVDAGRAKWVESLANDMRVPAGFVYKTRKSDGSVSVSGTNIPVSGKPVVIYDDMIRSGGSIIQACQAYKDAGASRIDVITTHGVFTTDAIDKMKKSGLIGSVTCTDSHPRALEIQDPFLKVVSTAEVFAAYLEGKHHAH
ncbi:MAG: phosphoribosyltransferase family protein, partial [Bdellovibrionota bacterium]